MSRTKIDRLAVSTSSTPTELAGALESFFPYKPEFRLQQRGKLGFQSSAKLTLDGALVASVMWGGPTQNGRCYADVTGLGCALVPNWERAVGALADVSAVLKRVDIAADFYHGEVNYESTKAAFDAGRFARGGRPPKAVELLPSRPEDGRTLYVGSRENDVFFRGYEKGRQLASTQYPEWFRLEIELKAVKRKMPPELIEYRDQFFAGSYPYLQDVLPEINPEVLVYPQRLACDDLGVLLEHIKHQFGPTLYTALAVHGGDFLAVWDRIVGDHHNEALVEAGVLLPA